MKQHWPTIIVAVCTVVLIAGGLFWDRHTARNPRKRDFVEEVSAWILFCVVISLIGWGLNGCAK